MMRKLLLLLVLLVVVQVTSGHPWKPLHYVIVDTDGGLDDMKAITMLLSSPDVRVVAIIASGGVLYPTDTYRKVRALLNRLHHEGLPVGINYNTGGYNYELPLGYSWGDESGIEVPSSSNFIEVTRNAAGINISTVDLVSLGSLNSAAILTGEGFAFRNIYWSVPSIDPVIGTNFDIDRESAITVLGAKTRITCIGYINEPVIYSDSVVAGIKSLNNPCSDIIYNLLDDSSPASAHPFVSGCTDEMIPIYLHYPELFNCELDGNVSFCQPTDSGSLGQSIIRILSGETNNRNQVIKNLPSEGSFYFDDISPFAGEIISLHGKEEWNSAIISAELHRHLGVFAVIGVKMGIRALEYFNAGVDEVKIVSKAGSIPPVSCMNDGLLTSTGATPGHGLLTVIDSTGIPSAEIYYGTRVISISLKKEYADKISTELQEINFVYGLDSDIYWELVRQKTILYWKNLSRYDIFDITEIK